MIQEKHTAAKRRCLALAAALGVACLAVPARGQERRLSAAETATRRNLIDEATAARNAGRHEQALELAERAARIQASPSLGLFTARVQVQLGRLADAFGSADACRRDAEAETSLRNRAQIIENCRALATELRPRVPRIVLRVPTRAPSLTVRLNGAEHGEALWDAPSLVNPGAIVVEATAPGYLPFRRQLDVAEGGNAELSIALEREPVVVEAPVVPEVPVTPVVTRSRGVPLGAVVLLGLGAATIGAGAGVYFGLRGGPIDYLNENCTALAAGVYECDAAIADEANRAQQQVGTAGLVGPVLLGVGGAAMAGGAAWLLVGMLRGGAEEPAPRAVLRPIPGGLQVFGRF